MRLLGTLALLIGPYLVPCAIDYAGLSKAVSGSRELEQQHARWSRHGGSSIGL